MTVVICNKHGSSPAGLVCPHIQEALISNKIVRYGYLTHKIREFDEVIDCYNFCANCLQEMKLEPNHSYYDQEINKQSRSSLIPFCYPCMKEKKDILLNVDSKMIG